MPSCCESQRETLPCIIGIFKHMIELFPTCFFRSVKTLYAYSLDYLKLNLFSGLISRFTTAIRTSFNFSGQENITVAGGEELWVFIAGHLVLELFHDPLNKTIPCATVNLAPVLKGNIIYTPMYTATPANTHNNKLNGSLGKC